MINMTGYRAATDFLNSFSKKGKAVTGLSRFSILMDKLGNPQDRLKYIHIAGTNGKGSVLEYCSSVLINKGYKVGQFTSPYIICYEDRIRINGSMISKSDVVKYISTVSKATGENRDYSQFEITAAIMFLYFAEQKCDIVCLETGLGGLLDATNIVKNTLVSAITSISYDHTAILGDTIEKITYQKAGIIKKDSTAVLSADNSAESIAVIKAYAKKMNADLIFTDINEIKNIVCSSFGVSFEYKGINYKTSMTGAFQALNAVTAIETLKNLKDFKLAENEIVSGIKLAFVPSRFEILREIPLLILDGAHNPAGTKALADTVRSVYENRKFTVICGMLSEKDIDSNVKNISSFADYVYTINDFTETAESGEELSAKFIDLGIPSASLNADKIKQVIENTDSDFIVCGSLYLTSYVRSILK